MLKNGYNAWNSKQQEKLCVMINENGLFCNDFDCNVTFLGNQHQHYFVIFRGHMLVKELT